MEPHRTAVAHGGKSRDASSPFIEVPKNMQEKGVPSPLHTLGPLACYELTLEVMDYLDRVSTNPSLLLEDNSTDNYARIFTSELHRHWWQYNRLLHIEVRMCACAYACVCVCHYVRFMCVCVCTCVRVCVHARARSSVAQRQRCEWTRNSTVLLGSH